jgi:hypothetical protein
VASLFKDLLDEDLHLILRDGPVAVNSLKQVVLLRDLSGLSHFRKRVEMLVLALEG